MHEMVPEGDSRPAPDQDSPSSRNAKAILQIWNEQGLDCGTELESPPIRWQDLLFYYTNHIMYIGIIRSIDIGPKI